MGRGLSSLLEFVFSEWTGAYFWCGGAAYYFRVCGYEIAEAILLLNYATSDSVAEKGEMSARGLCRCPEEWCEMSGFASVFGICLRLLHSFGQLVVSVINSVAASL